MKLGLIGYPLGHSKSPEIHRFIAGEEYSLWPLEKNELEKFFREKDFDGINVTIPYKLEVMKYLDVIDNDAKEIGAINTVVNKNGKLYGYNTDYLGLIKLLEGLKTRKEGAKAAILGSGGAARAACRAAAELGAAPVIVSRDPEKTRKESAFPKGTLIIGYSELYEKQEDFKILINATPLGMSPKLDGIAADLLKLPAAEAVVDIVANPLQTRLMYEARMLGKETAGGLRMLVAQALAAEELFQDRPFPKDLIGSCEAFIKSQMQNIVLIGMPSAGKTSVGRLLAQKLRMPFTDMDEMIVERIGMPIADYFEAEGEDAFRKIESSIAAELAERSGTVIATGGGIVKKEENMRYLSHNGVIIWIDRDISKLQGTPDRPLSKDAEALKKLWEERRPLYERYADLRIDANGTEESEAEAIIKACFPTR